MGRRRRQACEITPDEGTPGFVRAMTAVLLCGIGLTLAGWLWPAEINELSWEEMRLGMVLLAAAAGAVPLLFLAMACSLWRD